MNINESWALPNGHNRPFMALCNMTADDRDLIRKSLNFKWKDSQRNDIQLEAKEIIDCDLKGIVARLHTQMEMLNPFGKNLTWREVLERILREKFSLNFPAHLKEEQLEKLILQYYELETKRNSNPKEINTPIEGVSIVSTSTEIIIDIINEIGVHLDILLGSQDGPAVSAVISICAYLHQS